EQLEILIRIGAFRFTGKTKYELMWEKNAALDPQRQREGRFATGTLFEHPHEDFTLPRLHEGPNDQAFDEIELLGFPLCSPFELLAPGHDHEGILAEHLPRFVGRIVTILGYYVCKRDVRTVKGEWMAFGTWLDREGRFFDTTHFPDFLQRHPFRGKGIYRIEGRVVEEFGFPSLEAVRMQRLPFVRDERYDEA
ncbi:MAG: DNA polymerase III subunit alpha, partial [Bacteroidetes bacterium]